MWVLSSGAELVVQLREEFAARHLPLHLGILGSVVYRGWSANDIDIVVYPHRSDEPLDMPLIYSAFSSVGLRQIHDMARVHRAWQRQGSSDKKHVEVWADSHRKLIDFFFMK